MKARGKTHITGREESVPNCIEGRDPVFYGDGCDPGKNSETKAEYLKKVQYLADRFPGDAKLVKMAAKDAVLAERDHARGASPGRTRGVRDTGWDYESDLPKEDTDSDQNAGRATALTEQEMEAANLLMGFTPLLLDAEAKSHRLTLKEHFRFGIFMKRRIGIRQELNHRIDAYMKEDTE